MKYQLAELLDIPRLQSALDSLYINDIHLAEPCPIGNPVRYHENPPVQTVVHREAGQSGNIKLSRFVITMVVAVVICVFSVAPSHAADPQNKGEATARRSLKTIIVDNYQPYTFMNEKGSPDGFSVEIIKAVAKVMDLDLEIRAGTWEQATEELERGTIDLLPMMAYSVERDKKFDFSVRHTIAYDAIFHRSGDKSPGSLKDLSGKTVIVMNKDAAHDYLLSSGLSETMHLHPVDSLPEALRQLASGKGDAAIMPKLVGIITLKKLNLSNIDSSPPVIDRYTRPFSFAVKKGDQALLERLNQGLGIIKTTGQYDAIYKKWFGAPEGQNIPWKSALQLISLAGIILIAFAAWNVSLKHQVKSRTKDLEAKVAERKLKEEALRESEERYRSLFGKASDGIFIMSPDGKLIDVNESFARMHGYSTGELLQMNIGDLDTTKTAHLVPERIRQLLAGEILVFEVEHNHKDGHVFPLEVSANLISIRGESCIQSFHRDITERKRAEEEIRKHEEYLRVALSTTNMAVFNQDLDLRYSWMYQPQLGYTTEQVIGKRDAELLPPDLAQQVTELKRRVLETGVGTRGEIKGTLNDKSIYYDLAIQPMRNTAGQIVGIIGASLDITQRKKEEQEKDKLQAQLQQAMKMEAVGRLAGGVAHDFNNLLTVITGYSELLLRKIGKESPMHGEVEEIRRAGERAASLTQQLLAFSRKQIIEPRVVRLDLLVADMQAMLTRLIGEDIALQATTGKALGSVKVDPGQFQQILMNLAVNARDAMPGGGKIAIETANVDLDEGYCALHPYVKPGRFVMLAVSDTGKGMSKEVKAHIFEPFFTTKERGSGTGLGLATTYGVVKQAGGSIESYSEVGIGTTFKIYLPRVEEEAVKPVKDDRPTDLPGGTETVLVVEDEDIVRNLCVEILERLGYKVMQARNGAEAITVAQKYDDRINLLLTDVVMPGMNGSELATQLVLHHPEMKVLFTSGYTDDTITRHGVLDEGVSFIGKPYTPLALARKVREVLDKA